ncbi:hypothetical protein AA313_de0201901 [Arthrobotrys entomopaga]|nr:hypothetical protein AA313_de0201901 [Arthrobotrys entomopaga]
MDPRHPPHGDRRHVSSQRDASYEENQGEHYEDEGQEGYYEDEGQEEYYDQDEDQEGYYVQEARERQRKGHQHLDIDPELDKRPTILPPGTPVYRETNTAGQTFLWSPSSSRHQQQPQQPYLPQSPSVNAPAFDYNAYTFQGHNAANSYSPQAFARDAQMSGGPQRQRPEKKYLCRVEGCNRSVPGQGFTTLNDLERHGRSKHGDDGQYIECRHPDCPDKGKRFPRRDNFIDHYWRVHGNGASKEEIKDFVLKYIAKEWMVEKQGENWKSQ